MISPNIYLNIKTFEIMKAYFRNKCYSKLEEFRYCNMNTLLERIITTIIILHK